MNPQEKMPIPVGQPGPPMNAPPPYSEQSPYATPVAAPYPQPAMAPYPQAPQQQVPLMSPPPVSPNVAAPNMSSPKQPYPQQPPQMVGGPPPPMVGSPPHVVVAQPATVTNVVVTTQSAPLGHGPTNVTCPTCHHNVCTNVNRTLKAEAWICCCLLCLFGCELCFWIPFVMESNYRYEHSCPNCRSYVGTAL